MAFVTTKFGTVLPYRISYNSNITNAATSNLCNGPGTLYSVKVVNGNNAEVFVKIANALTATSGSTDPDWIFPCAASGTHTYEIPDGIAFDALSVWATENAIPSDNTAPSASLALNETISITLVTG